MMSSKSKKIGYQLSVMYIVARKTEYVNMQKILHKILSIAKYRFKLVGVMGQNVNDLQAFSDIFQISYILRSDAKYCR